MAALDLAAGGSEEEAVLEVLRPLLLHTAAAADPNAAGPSPGRVLLVKDTLQLSGLFVVHLLLKLCLHLGHRVVLVTVEQSLEKYKAVMRKVSVPLQPLLDSGQLVPLTLPTCAPPTSPPGTAAHALPAGPLSALAVQVHQAVRSQPQQPQTAGPATPPDAGPQLPMAWRPTAVVVDSLTDLECLATSHQEWLTFVRYLLTLTVIPFAAGQPGQEAAVQLCALRVHGDVCDGTPQLALLEHAAEAILQVQPLVGQVADIHGVVEVLTRNTRYQQRQGAAAAGVATERVGGEGIAHPLGGAIDIMAALTQPLQARQVLMFRATDLGVRWIPQVTPQHLLWR